MTNCTLWRDWLEGGSPTPDGCRRFLWIHGLPGSGKTILASYLNDQVAVHCGAKGSSFYYCLHEHNQDETVPFLRHIVRDFCFQLGCFVPEDLRRMWLLRRLGVNELKECLRVVTREVYTRLAKRVYIIVDAVDESLKPRGAFLRVLASIGTDAAFDHVSLLMTSRDEADIRAAIEKLPRVPLALSGPIGTQQLPYRGFSSYRAFSLSQAESEIMPTLDIPKRGFRGRDVPTLLPTSGRTPLRPASVTPPVRPSYLMDLDRSSSSGNAESIPGQPTSAVWHTGSSVSPDNSPTKSDAPAKRQLSGSQEPRSGSPTRRKISKGGSHVAGSGAVCHSVTDPDELDVDEGRLEGDRVPACSTLSMSNNFVREAIARVIEKRLEGSGRFGQWPREDFILRLRYKLAAKAAGIFRAVACYLDLIDRQQHLIDDEKILEAIDEMPDTIFQQYERILMTGIPNTGGLNRHNRDFARTALALICSETAEIPDVDVLVEASRFNVPQGRAQAYNLEKLNHLLGCLVKVQRLRRKPASLFPRKDEPGDFQRLAVAHYTVREYLYSNKTARGPATDFALSAESSRRLELKIAFYGLQQFLADRRCPTKHEEYCLRMTEKALAWRPALVAREKDIWEAVHPCLGWSDAHQVAVRRKQHTRAALSHWHRLGTAFAEGRAPEQRATCVVVSLLLLDWPRLAEVYLASLGDDQKHELWRDRFVLRETSSRGGGGGNIDGDDDDAVTVLEMCVSARRLDFLNVFVDAGAMFDDARGILFRALADPYRSPGTGGNNGGGFGGYANDRGEEGDDGSTTSRLLRILLERGADPDPGGKPWTPLQVATRELEPYWVQELLYHGARPDVVGSSGGGGYRDGGEEQEGESSNIGGGGGGSRSKGHTARETRKKWYHKTPLQICRETRPRWVQDDSEGLGAGLGDDVDDNLRWSRARVEQMLLAGLKNVDVVDAAAGVDDEEEDGRGGIEVIEILNE